MKVSLITITYNSSTTLKSTIDSVRSQTAKDEIEYIIVDGASKDGTADLIKDNLDTIDKWISEPDKGIYDAMNKGIHMATGDWIGFIHADDILASTTIIEDIINETSQTNINVIYGNLSYVKANNIDKTVRYWQSQPFKKQLLKRGWMPPHPTVYVKRDHLNKIGEYNTKYKISSDYDFILRLFANAETQSSFLDKMIVKMRLGGASNKSISNIILKSKEDYSALTKNNVGGFLSLFIKNFSKLAQFIDHN